MSDDLRYYGNSITHVWIDELNQVHVDQIPIGETQVTHFYRGDVIRRKKGISNSVWEDFVVKGVEEYRVFMHFQEGSADWLFIEGLKSSHGGNYGYDSRYFSWRADEFELVRKSDYPFVGARDYKAPAPRRNDGNGYVVIAAGLAKVQTYTDAEAYARKHVGRNDPLYIARLDTKVEVVQVAPTIKVEKL